MKNLIVLVGLSGSGKSYSAQKTCEVYCGTQCFSGDEVCRNLFSLFNVDKFGIINARRWQKIEKLGNTQLARYWLHIHLLQQVSVDVVIGQGYRYFFQDDRNCLETAVKALWTDVRLTYVHMKPDFDTYNRFRLRRGIGKVSEEKRQRMYSNLDLSFVDHEVGAYNELSLLLDSMGFKKRSADLVAGDTNLHISLPSNFCQPSFDIDGIKRLNNYPFCKDKFRFSISRRLSKAWSRRFSKQ